MSATPGNQCIDNVYLGMFVVRFILRYCSPYLTFLVTIGCGEIFHKSTNEFMVILYFYLIFSVIEELVFSDFSQIMYYIIIYELIV